jgi:hypothetical protein
MEDLSPMATAHASQIFSSAATHTATSRLCPVHILNFQHFHLQITYVTKYFLERERVLGSSCMANVARVASLLWLDSERESGLIMYGKCSPRSQPSVVGSYIFCKFKKCLPKKEKNFVFFCFCFVFVLF